jgi:hypothetical protein
MKSCALLVACALASIALGACASDERELVDELAVTTGDAIQACAIPDPAHIAGHDSEFYRCADVAANDGQGCGDDGYLLGYGAKYAERFYRVTRPRMSARGQRWIDDVLVCLQRTLQGGIDTSTSCQDIRTIAFDSHPVCYVDAGFCSLSVLDVLQVLWTIDAREWFGSGALRQAVRTAIGCGREYSGLIELWFAPWAR